jgi:hypothetical protein
MCIWNIHDFLAYGLFAGCVTKGPVECPIATLALGSQPRQGLVRVRAKREAREAHFMFPGVQKSVRE